MVEKQRTKRLINSENEAKALEAFISVTFFMVGKVSNPDCAVMMCDRSRVYIIQNVID